MATVFDLQATLGLDTKDFDDKLSGAVESVQGLSDQAESLTNPTLGGMQQTILQPVIDDAETVDAKLFDLQTKAKESSAVVDGFVEAVSDFVKASIEALIDFAADGIELASKTGSEAAEEFNQSKDSFTLGLELLKQETGERLLPFMELFYELGDAIVGKETSDKLYYLGQQLQQLSELNLKKTREEVKSTFDLFEEVENVKPGNVGDYQKGLESQTEYWQKYSETLNSLKEKGVDPRFLAEIADGSAESLEVLRGLDTADTDSLTNIMSAYTELQAAQEAAATSLNSVKLSVDESATAIADAFAILAGGGIIEDTSAWSGPDAITNVLQDYIDKISEKYPALESQVNAINDKLAELGFGANLLGLTGPTGEDGRIYKGDVGDGEKTRVITVGVEISEDTESNLQSDLDSLELGGEVLLKADPQSGTTLQSYLNSLNLTATVTLQVDDSALRGYEGRAVGLDYVPYDNYAAALHEGEAVLTKLEAERWRRGEGRGNSGGGTYNVTINVTETSASVEEISDAVLEAIDLARWKA